MAETKPTQVLQADDQAIDSPYVSNSRLRPNVETIAAMQAARSGEVQSFASINALLDDLDAAD